MAKNKETENKIDNKEQKVVKKKFLFKKKKIKKNIPNGIAYVQSSFNNTIVSIADKHKEMLFHGHLLDKKVLKDQENQHHTQPK